MSEPTYQSLVNLASQLRYSQGRSDIRQKVLDALEPYGRLVDMTDAQCRQALTSILESLADSIAEEKKLDV